ncbi:LpxL/LpxP family acyltransferase [Aliamphritea spongicola]|uniref:LpxL/LpxP family acyltransferase n=1 Tax=Aliamphritea spongicola TaxID=707589 RepID=UPI00196A7D2F|nr:lipid A biosynthesis acyltransferase [Aliamphritea spongicola]MBN3564435.1 lipid A biosynthesis acyltransferase [Aliamphritea spongicola]
MSAPQQHWSRVGEAGTILGMRVLLLVYSVFGRAGFRIILFPVMCYYYLVQGEARRASAEYLQQIRPLLPQAQASKLTSFKHFMAFGEALLDKFIVWMGKIRREDVTFATPELFAQLESHQQGGLIVISHLGNSEVCNALAHQVDGIRLTVLVHTHHAAKFNSILRKINSSATIELLQVNDMSPVTAMMLAERVNNGEYVVIAGDRTPVSNGGRVTSVDFLGRQADLPQGAFILASLLRCPVYLLFCLKQNGHYFLYLELFSEQLKFSRKQRDRELEAVVRQYAMRLEHYCFKAPLQWFNFYPFWNNGHNG